MKGPPLIAVAHGSRDLRAAATVQRLLDLVRDLRPGLRVRAGYLGHSAPAPGPLLDGFATGGEPSVVVLPLLLTAAYHSKQDLPRALAATRARHPRFVIDYGDTLGPDPALRGVLDRRLAEAGVATGDSAAAVVLAAAGSTDRRAVAVIRALAADWARHTGRTVVASFASAAGPTPGQAVARLRAAGARRVVVARYFLAPGYFADRVAEQAGAAGADAVTDVLGAAPELARLLLSRYDQARYGTAQASAG